MTSEFHNGAAARHRLGAPVATWPPLGSDRGLQPLEAVPQSLLRRSGVSTCLTDDQGVTWPGWAGKMLAASVLKAGGAV